MTSNEAELKKWVRTLLKGMEMREENRHIATTKEELMAYLIKRSYTGAQYAYIRADKVQDQLWDLEREIKGKSGRARKALRERILVLKAQRDLYLQMHDIVAFGCIVKPTPEDPEYWDHLKEASKKAEFDWP